MTTTKPTLPMSERLKNGAKKLGEIWKNEAERCAAGWSLDVCSCQPAKRFCNVRTLWLTLAIEAERELEEHPFGMALAMTASEWDATGLTLVVEHPEVGKLLIGSSMKSVTGMMDMAKMMDAPDVLATTLRVLRAFPRSKVEGLTDPVPAPKPEAAAVAVAEAANPDEAFE